jgi:hypothetical protein
MAQQHKIISVASRNTVDVADIAAKQLDELSADGWRLATAYAVADPLSSMTAHHFVLVRSKQQTNRKGTTDA